MEECTIYFVSSCNAARMSVGNKVGRFKTRKKRTLSKKVIYIFKMSIHPLKRIIFNKTVTSAVICNGHYVCFCLTCRNDHVTVLCYSCSQPPRKQHIPGYGGAVGAENLDELDNADIKFTPFTVKRVNIPRYSETSQ